VLNPLLLAAVYYLLVDVLGGTRGQSPAQNRAFFAQLTSGLFLYSYITGMLQAGTTSITQGGRLILNTPFPKILLTLSTAYQSFRRYLPTLAVYLVIHTVMRQAWTWHMLWLLPILVIATMMGLGLANLFATLQVYFRDTASFLPYFIRIWMYSSPVLWTVADTGPLSTFKRRVVEFALANPVFGPLASQGQALIEGRNPDLTYLFAVRL
jgi:teichoic acid transport system permease protein